VQYLKDPASSEWDNDAGMRLYKQIMAKYLPNANANDGLYLYGFAKAQSFVSLMYKVGRTGITRDKVMSTALNFTETSRQNPFFLPGVTSTTNSRDKFPISHIRPIRFNNPGWAAIGALVNPRGR
jgi:branched-chain amino acid transport system substrate-binding protein